ncbi:carcinoembryonic antigen-related cell adhesion molecule 3-like [Nannospalax galili]|uniref:carcinoembryonic antigen-related cell adhesion molecule 3-like n=1 Tax=Nannospalax galili TaxID=1026970 RepID=UPI00111C0E04|nr:carcinoembryonic antigen-related cell adhesion molecule 3-like [Nannospalax galili]
MAPPSAFCLRWPVTWWGLLLTVTLLSFWKLPTTAGLTVEAVPPHVAEGKSVLLLVHDLPGNIIIIRWFKWSTFRMVNGKNNEMDIGVTMGHYVTENIVMIHLQYTEPAYSNRVTLYTNGSLLIKNVTQKDAGIFILKIGIEMVGNYFSIGQFFVHKPVTQPSIKATNTTIAEKSSVVFTCLSGSPGTSIRWIFNNQSLQLTERMTLTQKNSRLNIDTVKEEDAGDYQCEVSNTVSSKKSHPVHLAVNSK